MSLVRKKRRTPLSLTSLIDVIFLLLLFFMLSSTFSKFGALEIPGGASAGGSSAQVETLFLRISPKNVTLNGRSVDLRSLDKTLASSESERRLIASFAEGVQAQTLADLLAKLRGFKGLSITLLAAQ